MKSVFFALLLSLLAATAVADSMRCGQALVIDGDPLEQVLRKCGEPDSERQGLKYVTPVYSNRGGYRVRHGEREIVTHRLTYDRGSTQFTRVLYFEDYRLIRIKLVEP